MREHLIDPILTKMKKRTRWQRWRCSPMVRNGLFALGWLLIFAAAPIGILPGPGGMFVFAAGLALVLETSPWAKRVYVRAARRWPRLGGWMDWGLRRKSAKRRQARDAPAITAAD